MRLRTLDLIRYGGFSDRAIDFGDGRVDFHLFVGPNEAGKSTLRAAISDLLFGIHERTPYGFRHGMSELSLAATLEQGDLSLDIVRRKKRKDPLTSKAGAPMTEDALYPFLSGADEDSYAQMFSLDQERLRQGGDSVLRGGDSAARVVLEAEGGLSGLGALLNALDAEADGLFSGTARVRPLNVKLKARKDAEHRAREASVDERHWLAINERLTAAEARRRTLLDRLSDIAGRKAILERARRVRPLLVAMTGRQADLLPLAGLPQLPADAQSRLVAAERTLTEDQARLDTLNSDLARIKSAQGQIDLPSSVLDAAAEIQALVDRRSVYLDRRRALPRRVDDLNAIDARVAQIRRDAGLPAAAEPPVKLERERLRQAHERTRIVQRDLARLRAQERRQADEWEAAGRRLSAMGSLEGLAALRAALDDYPRDISQRRTEARRVIAAAEARLAAALQALAPWTGDVAALRSIPIPSVETIEAARILYDEFDAERAQLRRASLELQRDLVDARAEQAKLGDAEEELPTPAAIRAIRRRRDAAWEALSHGSTGPDWAAAAATYEALVKDADSLADRREAEAGRIAKYLMQTAEITRLEDRLKVASIGLERLVEDAARADAHWEQVRLGMGLSAPFSPHQVNGWLAARREALQLASDLLDLQKDADAADAVVLRRGQALQEALAGAGLGAILDDDPDVVLRRAMAAAASQEAQRLERTKAETSMASLQTDLARTTALIGEAQRDAAIAAEALAAALERCSLDQSADEIAIDAALEAFEGLATELGGRVQMAGRVREIQADVDDFEAALAPLLHRLGQAKGDGRTDSRVEDAAETVRELGVALTSALAAQADALKVQTEAQRLAAEIERISGTTRIARLELERLAGAAGLADPSGLADVIERVARRDRLAAEVEALRSQIIEAGDGLQLDALQAELQSLSLDTVDAELLSLTAEQDDLNRQRDALATEVSDAAREVRARASSSEAAAALQAAEDARAEAGVQAEQYVRAKSTAALLRWAISRHRTTRAAPLLERASAIMQTVTRGGFGRIGLNYEQGEIPVLVGVRPSGEEVIASAMSEGTRDQLYLSMRLAAIEARSAQHAMPFIADDLLVNGDDERAAAMIGALGHLAGSCQVLCFTHHDHVVDLARQAVGPDGFHLHRLARLPVAA